MDDRVLVSFSCGIPSAVTAKMAVETYGERALVYYCDTFKYEHPDNRRFFNDVQNWIGREIKVWKSEEYEDIFDVFHRSRWLVGVGGARCTTELKKMVRIANQLPGDIHAFGFTVEEKTRVDRFYRENPDLQTDMILYRNGITRAECFRRVREAGIEQPVMYRLGYKNNNCIGCVKGQSGYWNKIRRDFPEAFERMAKTERQLNAAICKKEGVEVVRDEKGEPVMTVDADGEPTVLTRRWRKRVFLDELPPDAGRYTAEPDIECGVLCIHEPAELNPERDPYSETDAALLAAAVLV